MGDTLLLSFDFEDWHQLVHRRLGLPDWDKVNPAFPRQVRLSLREVSFTILNRA